MRLYTLLIVGMATFTAQHTVLPVAAGYLPSRWVYELAPACSWRAQRWVYALGDPLVPRIDMDGRRSEWRCLHAKGLKSLVIFGAVVSPRWPEPATIARWETEDARPEYNPPHPDWRLALPRD